MPAIGMLLGWSGYSLTLWGFTLVRGMNISLGQLMSPLHPFSGPWPKPGSASASVIFPTGTASSAASTAPTATATAKPAPGAIAPTPAAPGSTVGLA